MKALKSNYLFISLVILFAVLWLNDCSLRRKAEEKRSIDIAVLEEKNDNLFNENERLINDNWLLVQENEKLAEKEDSFLIVETNLNERIRHLQRQHDNTISGIVSIPVESDVSDDYLQARYDYAGEKIYLYNRLQTRQMHLDVLGFDHLKEKAVVQDSLLGNCKAVVEIKSEIIENQSEQLLNLADQNHNLETVIENKDETIAILNKDKKRGRFWGWVEKGVSFALGVIAGKTI